VIAVTAKAVRIRKPIIAALWRRKHFAALHLGMFHHLPEPSRA
jgi:hypothetical protein